MLNDTIVNELSDVKAMLDQKAKQLAHKEAEVKRKEAAFIKMKTQALKELESAFQTKLLETETKFKQETKNLQKKWTNAEKSIKEKFKVV